MWRAGRQLSPTPAHIGPRSTEQRYNHRTRPGNKWGDQQNRFPFLKRDVKPVRKKPRVQELLPTLASPNQKLFACHTVLFSSFEKILCVVHWKVHALWKVQCSVWMQGGGVVTVIMIISAGEEEEGPGSWGSFPSPVPPAVSANWSAGRLG